MEIFFCWIVLLSLCSVAYSDAREIKQDELLLTTRLLVDGHDFFHRSRVEGGVRTDIWKIDEVAVDKEVYEERLLDAEKEERRRVLRREASAVADEALLRQQNRLALLKKLLESQVQLCAAEVEQIDRQGLRTFMVFEPETFVDQADFDRLVTDFLPLARSQSDASEQELAHFVRRSEDYLVRLKKFKQVAVAQAIQKSDDPQVLKELLKSYV